QRVRSYHFLVLSSTNTGLFVFQPSVLVWTSSSTVLI
ncbi:hypothetical protein LEMLEM_LOCUS22020, partial [Lemmus lemmus]